MNTDTRTNPPGEKNCKCGHPRRLHRDYVEGGRAPCIGELRQFIYPIPDHLKSHKRDSDIELNKEQAETVVKELEKKVARAPSYEGKLNKLLKKGYRVIDCQCPLFHLVELGGVKIYKPGESSGPGGKVVL